MTADQGRLHRRIHALLDPARARAVLDVGCGRGEDLRRLGAAAPDGARLVGVDASEASLAEARWASEGDPRFTFLAHDVAAGLPFGDGEFDRVLSVNLLECIPGKQELLREVHRVLAPDGIVVFAHWDWDTQLVDGADRARVRRVLHAFADWKQAWMADADPWMGRRLWRTFQESGLFEGSVHPYVLTSTRFEPGTYGYETIESFRGLVKRGMLAAEEYEEFRRTVEELAASDRYFYSITLFAYAGRKR